MKSIILRLITVAGIASGVVGVIVLSEALCAHRVPDAPEFLVASATVCPVLRTGPRHEYPMCLCRRTGIRTVSLPKPGVAGDGRMAVAASTFHPFLLGVILVATEVGP